ncbi:MAG: hypothetical protein IIA36_03780 [Proteobacteria bacterium]|nr:hypothetical protein [Pseudomonadota bacterium]
MKTKEATSSAVIKMLAVPHSMSDPQKYRTKEEVAKFREELVNANPEESYRVITEHRRNASQVSLDAIQIKGVKVRSKITKAKQPMLNAIRRILRERRKFLPLTVRAIHYALLNDPPLKHASKPDSVYVNDQDSYKALDELLVRARLASLIPHSVIHDPTRPVTTWKVHQNPRVFVRDELDGFLKGYYRDLMQSQPNHIEIIGEKNTVDPIMKSVAGE